MLCDKKKPLAIIFTHILNQQKIPVKLKESVITPVQKKKKLTIMKSKTLDQCPISIQLQKYLKVLFTQLSQTTSLTKFPKNNMGL